MDKAYNFPKEKTQPKILATTPTEVATAPVEVATTPAEAATAPAHSTMAPAVVPEIEGSHKDYLTIFSQTMNLMPNIFSSKQDVIWMTSFSCNSCD